MKRSLVLRLGLAGSLALALMAAAQGPPPTPEPPANVSRVGTIADAGLGRVRRV